MSGREREFIARRMTETLVGRILADVERITLGEINRRLRDLEAALDEVLTARVA